MPKQRSRHPSQQRCHGLSAAAQRMFDKAWAALASKQFSGAESALIGVMAMAPDCVEAQRVLGLVQHLQGEHAKAIANFRQAHAALPDDELILTNLGNALSSADAADEAMPLLRRACELAPDMTEAWFNLGRACRRHADPEAACKALQRVLALDSGHIPARIVLAEVQTSMGDVAEACENYRALLRQQPGHADAWLGLANLGAERFSAQDVAALQHAWRAPGLPEKTRAKLGFALTRALEDQKDYPAALDALHQANALIHKRSAWDSVAANAYAKAIQDAFQEQAAPALNPNLGQEVIFVVSLPRSGSTLVEQILASHEEVEGADELTDLQQVIDAESVRRGQRFPSWVEAATPHDWERMGRDYMERTARWRRSKPRFTDKNVLNWQLVGAAMAMLPGARVVNCRRDPFENCFGCYRQLFSRGSYFSYKLEDMAAYWHDHDRLSRHWQRLFPDNFFVHSHEKLLAEPETQIRELLAFCNLAYDPACLEFHRTRRVVKTASAAQVRRPLQRGVPRSDLYGDGLEPLRALLADAIGQEPGR